MGEQRGGHEGPAADTDLSREIGHDEYDPIGTLTLIALYFLILLFMWFFVYFVEFVGNEPTVTGVLGPVVIG